MVEKRMLMSDASSFDTREDDGKLYISGYFSVFDSSYEFAPKMTESIDPHAFDKALDDDIRCLIDHDSRLVLGRTKSGTLQLRVDAKGLWGEVEVNRNDQDAMNLYYRVQRHDVDQCSFGFDILDEERSVNDVTGEVHYLIKVVKLYELSVVTFPAYESTEVSARMKDMGAEKKRMIEAAKEKMKKKLKGVQTC